jgi:hypothetical protein
MVGFVETAGGIQARRHTSGQGQFPALTVQIVE